MNKKSVLRGVIGVGVGLAAACGLGIGGVAQAQCEQGWIAGAGLPATAGVVSDVRVFVTQGAEPRQYVIASGPREIGGAVNTNSSWLVHDGSSWRLLHSYPGVPAGIVNNTTVRTTRNLAYFSNASLLVTWDGSTFTTFPSLANSSDFFVSESDEGDQAFLFDRPSSGSTFWRLNRLVKGAWVQIPSTASARDGVRCIEFLDDVAGGRFVAVRVVGNQTGLYRFDPTGWTLLNTIVQAPLVAPHTASFKFLKQGTGASTRLVLSGPIDAIDGTPVKHIAVLQGGVWSPLGGGLVQPASQLTRDPLNPATGVIVISPDVVRNGQQATLGGFFVRRLTANGWSAIAPQLRSDVYSYNDPLVPINTLASGRDLILGGNFGTVTGPEDQQGIAAWNGSEWRGLGPTSGYGRVAAIEEFDLGDGPQVYVSGGFSSVGAQTLNHVAKWTGTAWQNLGQGIRAVPGVVSNTGTVNALAMQMTSDGPRLLAGTTGDTLPAGILSLESSGWVQRLNTNGVNTCVNAFERFDSGSGPELYSLIKFANPILWKLGATSWQAASSPTAQWTGPYAMKSFNDGSGDALYVCGAVSSGRPCVFRRVGQTWQTIMTGVPNRNNGVSPTGMCLATWPVDGVERLVMGGSWYIDFPSPARFATMFWWNGATWNEFEPRPPGAVADLTVHDFGNGPTLVALLLQTQGGAATSYESARRMRPYRLVNGAWEPFGTVDLVHPSALYSHATATGVIRSINGELWMGGPFTAVDGIPSNYVARYGCNCVANFNRDSALDLFDYLDFVAAFADRAPGADFNRDGSIDFFDYLDFVSRFASGC
jgi:hypothetical protein